MGSRSGRKTLFNVVNLHLMSSTILSAIARLVVDSGTLASSSPSSAHIPSDISAGSEERTPKQLEPEDRWPRRTKPEGQSGSVWIENVSDFFSRV